MRRSRAAQKGEQGGVEARNALGLNETQPLDDILRSLERTTELQVFVRPLGDDGIAGAYWVSDICSSYRSERYQDWACSSGMSWW